MGIIRQGANWLPLFILTLRFATMGSIYKKLFIPLFRAFLESSLAIAALPVLLPVLLPIATLLGSVHEAAAQVTANESANTATQIDVVDGSTINISGGQRSNDGSNLFHGFDSFNIGSGQTASFITPADLENVISHISGGQSNIDGLLQVLGSEANLYLINPSGIFFGPNTQLNLPGSFTAATATDIGFGDQWLNLLTLAEQPIDYGALRGSPTAFDFATASPIVNLGNLSVGSARSLSLFGGNVINTGTLSAPAGNITITAVSQSNLLRLSQPNTILSLEVSPNAPSDLTAVSLSELLTGTGLPEIDKLQVNADGTVSLLSTVLPGGTGNAIVSGQVSAEGDRGGDINIFGTQQVALLDANLSANGRSGGGALRLGGDYQGRNTAPTAQRTYIDRLTTLTADTLNQGNGGQVYVWSETATQFYGHISTQGGALAGDGGFVELSSKLGLTYEGTVNLEAPQGALGTLLFDPDRIIIRNGARPGGPVPPGLPTVLLNDAPINFVVYEETLEGFASVTLQALLDITIEPLTNDGVLTFMPGGNIRFDVDANNTGTGTFRMDANDTIQAPNGSIRITRGNMADTAPAVFEIGTLDTTNGGAGGGNITLENLDQTGELDIRGLIAGTGDITLVGSSIDFNGGPNTVSGNLLTMRPPRANANIFLGDGPNTPGQLRLSTTDIAALSNTINQLSIGRSDSTAEISMGADIADGTGNGFRSPTTLRGNAATPASSTLIGTNADTTWTITGQNRGTLSNFAQISFEDIANLRTGTGNDTIAFSNAAAEIATSILDAGGDLTFTGDTLNLPNTIEGTGRLVIQPSSAGRAIEVGGAGTTPGIAAITTADFNGIQDTFTSVEIGSNSSGTLTLTQALLSDNALILRSGEDIVTTAGALSVLNPGNDLSLIAGGAINAGAIATGGGGVILNAPNSITALYVDARENPANPMSAGGNIDIDTAGLLRVTGLVPPGAPDLFSIATGLDGAVPASIAIAHGGNATAFSIGDASVNGTAGQITNQTTTLPNQNILGDRTEGNIQITTNYVPPTPPAPPMTPPTTPQTALENQPFIAPVLDEKDSLSVVLSGDNEAEAARIFRRLETVAGSQFGEYLALGRQNRPIATLSQAKDTLKAAEDNLDIRPGMVYVFFVADAIEDSGPKSASSSDSSSDSLSEQPQLGRPSIAQTAAIPESRPDDQLAVMLITAEGNTVIRPVWGITREQVEAQARELRYQATSQFSRPSEYLPPAQQLYDWILQPIQSELEQRDISSLSFILDDGLRTFPIAALHDGEQFLLEHYSIGLMPSFSLTELAPEYSSGSTLHQSEVLAMGASQFTNQPPLPAVEAELDLIAGDLWAGEAFLNEAFTLANLTSEITQERYGIVHLATHAVFEPGDYDSSYIQLWNEQITLPELDRLNLSESTIDLIILSACNTAVGDRTSEYGFAGFAVNAGSQSALASLWPVSDEGTLSFMTQFYEQYATTNTRAEALRRAQTALLSGNIIIENGTVIGPEGDAIAHIPELAESGSWDFSHPFYWSAFTMIGNPW
ncbi:MAG: CHAT domain-containing protein [Cyanobacteria bacterium J06554_3]